MFRSKRGSVILEELVIPLLHPPTHLPRTRREGGSRPVDPSDKEGGGSSQGWGAVTSQGEGEGGGGAAPEQRRS